MLLVCSGIGLPVAALLPPQFAGRMLVAPVLGLAILAAVAPGAYRVGISPLTLLLLGGAGAVASFVWWGRRLAADGSERAERRVALLVVAAWLGVLVILMLPRWVGGDQFSVFQGNVWDAFGYLESSLVYARRAYAVVSEASDAVQTTHPLFPIAQNNLAFRPSVELLYAMFSWVAPEQAYRLHYSFLAGCLSQFFLAAVFLVRAVFPDARPVVWIAAAAVFPLGFWGQYVFDLDAWSQIASAPVLFLMVGLALRMTIAPAAPGEDVRAAAVLAVLVAGAVYLYAEGWLITSAGLWPVVVAVLAIRMVRARRLTLRPLLPLAGLAGLITVAAYPPTLPFLIGQVTWTSGSRVSWWVHFQGFFRGRDAAPDSLLDSVAGFFGLYFATPAATASAGVALLERAAIAIALVGSFAGLAVLVARARALAWPSRAMLLAWLAVAVVMLLPAGYFFLQDNFWPAGKLVSYAAPVYMTLLAVPIAFRFPERALRPLRWIAIVFVAFQLSLGAARVVAAGSPDGVLYASPYPSGSRLGYGWDLTVLDEHLKPGQKVLIHYMDRWPEAYLMMYMFTHRIRFATVAPVESYFYGGRTIGTTKLPNPDVEISIDGEVLILRFRGGRPDLRIRSRRDGSRT